MLCESPGTGGVELQTPLANADQVAAACASLRWDRSSPGVLLAI